MKILRRDRPFYVLDPDVLTRYPERQIVFQRRGSDKTAPFYGRSQHDAALAKAEQGLVGYTRVEAAMASAAWTAAEHFHGAYGLGELGGIDPMLRDVGRHTVTDPAEMAVQIKLAARLYGAGAVGICALDLRWVYASDRSGREIEVPDGLRTAVVMAIPMDVAAIAGSPGLAAEAATGAGYSRMALVAASLAQFIRKLGYRALAMGNDTALSIPLAIDAGLGELGRNGLLITPEYGPCVRLCKVFTDLPLVVDRPISFGLEHTCRACGRCAEACEVGAISSAPTLSFEVACDTNNPGVRRWAVDFDRCYTYWMDNGGSCSSCIAACPFTPKMT